MRISLQRGVPMVVLLGLLVLRIADPAALIGLRLRVFDELQRMLPRSYVETPIRVIDLDDSTLQQYGQWPWPRNLVARLVTKLHEAGVAAIAFDMVFAEPDRTAPRIMEKTWDPENRLQELSEILAGLPDPDAVLAQSFGTAPVVTGFVMSANENGRIPERKAGFASAGADPRRFVLSYRGAIANVPLLEKAARGNGTFNAVPSSDGVIRHLPLIMQMNGRLYPSLAAEALRVAQGATTYLVKASGAQGVASLGGYDGIDRIQIGAFQIPTDRNGNIWLYDTGHEAQRLIPAWQVLRQEAPDLSGKIVFIGTSALGLKDQRATPLEGAVPGAELHAQALEQIISGHYLRRPYWADPTEILLLFTLGSAMIFLLPRLGPISCAVAGGIAAMIGIVLAIIAFINFGWLFDPVYPALAALLVYSSGSLMGYVRAELERRQVRQAFSRYLAPAMVARLAADPRRLRLGGEMRDTTVMFCDIRDFTSIAERLDAADLTRLINLFLTEMSDAVLAYGGTIDKYIGDSLMAFWNAPLDDPQHQKNACLAALAMRDRLKDLNEKLRHGDIEIGKDALTEPPELRIGIGINSGMNCVGNLGSEQRFNYSVLGDNVNIAARLEGLTKIYGVDIICSEATQAKCRGLRFRPLGNVQVKGRKGQIDIFTLESAEENLSVMEAVAQ
jgi:adenylate cyclase